MPATNQKILILRLSSIGDILLTSGFVRQVRHKFSDAAIDFVIKKKFYPLVQHNPHINTIYCVEGDRGLSELFRLRKLLSLNGYTHIFDLHNNQRTKLLTLGITADHFYRIRKNKLKRALLVYLKINLFKKIVPIPEKYLAVGRRAGVADDGYGLELYWNNEVEQEVDRILHTHKIDQPYVVIAPGAGFYTKRWPADAVQELLLMIADTHIKKIVLLGSKNEKPSFLALENSPKVVNLAGKVDLLPAAAIMNKAQAVVSNDSGLMHMATAVRRPVVALFGSTVRELGFFPYRSIHKIVEVNKLWCRPCSHVGRRTCPLGHFKCMRQIPADRVFRELKDYL